MTLINCVERALIELHREKKQEWIHLSDIYKRVEKIRGKANANKGASIRTALEVHSTLSSAFSGNELFVLKKKGTGFYKIANYDKLIAIEKLKSGMIFTNSQIHDLFMVSLMKGIAKSNRLNLLVLVSNENKGIYNDSDIVDGRVIYTVEGLNNEQKLEGNNKTLYESNQTKIPIYYFTKDNNRNYTFQGRVTLDGEPFTEKELDKSGKTRTVWKFPLKIINPKNIINEINSADVISEVENLERRIAISEINKDLIFIDEPIAVRKYVEKKEREEIKRTKKPEYIANEIVKCKQGEINEKAIFEHEIAKMAEKDASDIIEKMENFFKNKKDNEGFDILSFELDEKNNYIEKYIEVKSTKGDEQTPIDITDAELEFAKNHINNYYIYRVIKSDSEDRYVKVISGKELFDKFQFIAMTYKIYSK